MAERRNFPYLYLNIYIYILNRVPYKQFLTNTKIATFSFYLKLRFVQYNIFIINYKKHDFYTRISIYGYIAIVYFSTMYDQQHVSL